MSLTFSQVAVTTSATPLVTVPPGASVTLLASAATEVGPSGVTSSTGFVLPASVPVTFTLEDTATNAAVALYGVTATTSTVSIALSD